MSVLDGVDDVQLLRRAQKGEAEAFGELYERHAVAIFRYLYARLDNPLDAEDLTEEVFLRFWRSLSTYREKGIPLTAYLFRIASNALIDHYRRSQRSSRNVSLHDGQWITSQPNPADMAIANVEHQEIRQALGRLRKDYRNVLILRFLSELTPVETAQAMNRSVGAVRILQHRALRALRRVLARSQDRKDGR